MNERLQKFLDAENISQAFFAETVGVTRASVSHILSGRNKPGYEFINSMMIHYPRLNIEWMLSGKGKMYKDMASEKDFRNNDNIGQMQSLFPETTDNMTPGSDNNSDIHQSFQNIGISETSQSAKTTENKRRIERIVIFYDDNTFEEIS